MTSTFPSLILSSMPQNLSNLTDDSCVFNEEFKFFLLPLSYTAVFILGLPLNITAMWIFITKMRPWSPTTVYMFNLALSDTFYVLSLPTLIYYYADRNNWPFGDIMCRIVRFIFYTNLYSSILFLTCISVHRYLGVCHPMRSLQRIKVKHARIACTGVWVSVTLCLVPNLIYVTISPRGNDTICHDTTVPEQFEAYVEYCTSIMSLLFGIPFLVITICYGLMARELNKPSAGGFHHSLPSYKRKSIRTIVCVLLVFFICFLPFHITRTMYYYARLMDADCQFLNVINVSYKITRPLASANSCIDPILYFLASDSYQRRLVRAVARVPSTRRRHVIEGHTASQLAEGSLAVISTVEAQSIGSLGNLRGYMEEEGKKGIREKTRGEEKTETYATERECGMMNADGKTRDNVEVLKNEEGDLMQRELKGIRGELGENGIEGNTNKRDIGIKDKRKGHGTGGEKKRHKRCRWSLCRHKDTADMSAVNQCEAEGSSTWNLLEPVRCSNRWQRVTSLREEDDGREHRLQSLPKV
ncbi:P2Y purinoceptor 4 [Discoglossus pictus]